VFFSLFDRKNLTVLFLKKIPITSKRPHGSPTIFLLPMPKTIYLLKAPVEEVEKTVVFAVAHGLNYS
jgi:hypothetical protein